MSGEPCDHILGTIKIDNADYFVYQSDCVSFPEVPFQYCPVCGTKLNVSIGQRAHAKEKSQR